VTAFTFRDLAFVSGRRLLYPTYVQDYLDRVTAADVAAGNTLGLELSVTDAFNTCLQAMVADTSLGVSGGVLAQAASLIKASCAMQGARTLSGALVPLAADMPAPTNFNFVAGDYNRRTGLGDPANVSKYLDTNRNNNADPQNSNHLAVYVSSVGSPGSIFISSNNQPTNTGHTNVLHGGNGLFFHRSRSAAGTSSGASMVAGFSGISRNTGTQYIARTASTNFTVSVASDGLASSPIHVYRRNLEYSSARLAFYSIGLDLSLAAIDARITALANAIQAAIAP
jgi:hypothetical protein